MCLGEGPNFFQKLIHNPQVVFLDYSVNVFLDDSLKLLLR